MRKPSALFVLAFIVAVVVSCRMVETLTGNPTAGTVSSLWPDVPPFAGATKADLEIPLGARLAIRAAMQGKINFIAFNTNKSAQEVQDFYSKQRMQAAGWTPNEKGCISDNESGKSHGAICFFSRKDNDKEEGLAIIVAQDEKTKETGIIYARADLTAASPSPSRR